jgi:hypothetical protein
VCYQTARPSCLVYLNDLSAVLGMSWADSLIGWDGRTYCMRYGVTPYNCYVTVKLNSFGSDIALVLHALMKC